MNGADGRDASRALIPREAITGMVLSGGQGSRMGGIDKGLQTYHGMPLALHALMRLGPQVGHLMINANRNLGAYESMGVPVWPDPMGERPGPLAGFLAGLERMETEWLVTVPCDAPDFPLDLVERLAAAAVAEQARIAFAVTRREDRWQPQPVFCLMHADVLGSVVRSLQQGEHRIAAWASQHPLARVPFPDPAAFANLNTFEALQRHEAGQPVDEEHRP